MIHGGKVHTEPSRRFLRFWPVQAGGSAAPATFLVLRLLESNPHFVGAQTTLYQKREAAFLFSRNIPPSPCGSQKGGNRPQLSGCRKYRGIGERHNKHFRICTYTCIACQFCLWDSCPAAQGESLTGTEEKTHHAGACIEVRPSGSKSAAKEET